MHGAVFVETRDAGAEYEPIGFVGNLVVGLILGEANGEMRLAPVFIFRDEVRIGEWHKIRVIVHNLNIQITRS